MYYHSRHSWTISVCFVFAATAILGAQPVAGESGSLTYRPQANTLLMYKVEITASLPSAIETYKGTISYQVLSVGNVLKMKHQGSLSQSSKQKNGNRSRPHFPSASRFPRMIAFHSINRTTQLTLTPRGHCQTMEGESQLPYLLGNLSILIFEPLPETNRNSWTVKQGGLVTEGNDSPFPRFGPLFHNSRRKTTSASETITFTHQSNQGDLSTYRKTYLFDVPDDTAHITAKGTGKWTFNRKLGMPESLDYSGKLVIKGDNVTATIPLTIKYHRLSDEEQAKIKRDRQKRIAEISGPIAKDQRKEILDGLKSKNRTKLIAALSKLVKREPETDEEIARALEPLCNHSNRTVRRLALMALKKFSPESEKYELRDKYTSHGVIHEDELGARITKNTPLPKGLFIAYYDGHWWRPGIVAGVIETDQVVVKSHVFDKTKIVARMHLRLPPPEVNQPNVDPEDLPKQLAAAMKRLTRPDTPSPPEFDIAAAKAYRVWTDSTATFTIMAKYLGVENNKVRLLRKQDGKETKVPLAKLSEADRQLVEKLQRSPKRSNPFE